MKNEDLLNELDRRLGDQRELMQAKFTHLSAILQDGFEQAREQRREIITHQKETNGRVNCLERNLAFVRWCGKNPRLAIPLLFIIGIGLYFGLQYFGYTLFNIL